MGRFRSWGYLNRTLCDVLLEMRKCSETKNFSYLPGLVEEAQSMADSMESALTNNKDIKEGRAEIKELKAKYRKLKQKIKKAEKKLASKSLKS